MARETAAFGRDGSRWTFAQVRDVSQIRRTARGIVSVLHATVAARKKHVRDDRLRAARVSKPRCPFGPGLLGTSDPMKTVGDSPVFSTERLYVCHDHPLPHGRGSLASAW